VTNVTIIDILIIIMIFSMKRKYYKLKVALFVLLFTFGMYCSAMCTVMRFKHPEYTETQLLMSLKRAIVWDFN
jgi:hypothetical protein